MGSAWPLMTQLPISPSSVLAAAAEALSAGTGRRWSLPTSPLRPSADLLPAQVAHSAGWLSSGTRVCAPSLHCSCFRGRTRHSRVLFKWPGRDPRVRIFPKFPSDGNAPGPGATLRSKANPSPGLRVVRFSDWFLPPRSGRLLSTWTSISKAELWSDKASGL